MANMNGRVILENRIEVEEDIALNEWKYVYGDKKNDIVTFSYYNVKYDRVNTLSLKYTYNQALAFARSRRGDGRYKNFEFWIDKA